MFPCVPLNGREYPLASCLARLCQSTADITTEEADELPEIVGDYLETDNRPSKGGVGALNGGPLVGGFPAFGKQTIADTGAERATANRDGIFPALGLVRLYLCGGTLGDVD